MERRRFIGVIAGGLLVASVSEAQRDPLIGTWEGQNDDPSTPGDPSRTLIIQMMSGNLASGLFGYTGKRLGGVGITIDRSGNRPSITFVTGFGATIRLTLMNEKWLFVESCG